MAASASHPPWVRVTSRWSVSVPTRLRRRLLSAALLFSLSALAILFLLAFCGGRRDADDASEWLHVFRHRPLGAHALGE